MSFIYGNLKWTAIFVTDCDIHNIIYIKCIQWKWKITNDLTIRPATTHRIKTHCSRVSALFSAHFNFIYFYYMYYIYIYALLCFPGWIWRGSTLRDYTIKWIRNEITPPTRYFRISNPPTRLVARFYFHFAVSPSLPCALRQRVYDDAWWQSFVRHAPSVVMRMWCYMRAGGRCSFIWRGWNGS